MFHNCDCKCNFIYHNMILMKCYFISSNCVLIILSFSLFFFSQQCLYLTIWPFLYKCEFIFHNVTFNLVNVTLFLKTVTLYLIMCIYLIIVTLLQLTLYLIMWLLSYNCFFISQNCNSISHVTFLFHNCDFMTCSFIRYFKFLTFFFFFFTLRQEQASINIS